MQYKITPLIHAKKRGHSNTHKPKHHGTAGNNLCTEV